MRPFAFLDPILGWNLTGVVICGHVFWSHTRRHGSIGWRMAS
jgi:hypothetical protein